MNKDKIRLGAPKFGIEHLIFEILENKYADFFLTLTFKSDKTNCILIATAMPFDQYIHV